MCRIGGDEMFSQLLDCTVPGSYSTVFCTVSTGMYQMYVPVSAALKNFERSFACPCVMVVIKFTWFLCFSMLQIQFCLEIIKFFKYYFDSTIFI